MDTGGWFVVDDILAKSNRYIFAQYSRARSAMRLDEMARRASDGTEDLTKMRWQFSVMIKRLVRHGSSLWQRIVKGFGARAVVGHTAVPFLEDGRLQVYAENVPSEAFACIAHNTEERHLHSIIVNGRIPGGGGITDAVHSQLSVFHINHERLQESSPVGSTDGVVHFNVERTKPLINICASGTRKVLPGTLIDRMWVKREVPIRLRDGRTVVSRRWATYANTSVEKLRVTGWIGAQKSGCSDEFKLAIMKLSRHSRTMPFCGRLYINVSFVWV